MRSHDAAHFDRLYTSCDDPWNFRASPYERGKYAETVAAFPPGRFIRALEVGCSIGELTRLLAPICDDVVGVDISEAPLITARAHSNDLAHVQFLRMAAPREWPDGWFDLIVLSEVLYFLSPEDIRSVAARVEASLLPAGVVILVNFLGATNGDPSTGNVAAEIFSAAISRHLALDMQLRRDRFRIDRLVRNL